jgi:putative DNA primase/helicase
MPSATDTSSQAHQEKGNLLLWAALAYAKRGWRVFPLHKLTQGRCSCQHPGCTNVGKHPRTEHGHNDATTDETVIRMWWETEWPTANVGIRTGAESGLVVLDVDPRHGGDESLRQLEAEHGSLPETVTALSGGGGRHLYFRHPGFRISSRAEALGSGLDIRGDGGSVVAWPSLHASGKQYLWAPGRNPDRSLVAPIPTWLLTLLREVRPTGAHTRTTPVSDEGEPIPERKRNDTLTSLAGRMRYQGMSEEEIATALLVINEQRCQPPLERGEVQGIARSVAKYPVGASTAQEPYTDLGNAKRFIARHGHELRYVPAWGKWLIWDGARWAVDKTEEVTDRAKETIRSFYGELTGIFDDDKRRAFNQHIARSESYGRIVDMLALARSELDISITPDQLDCDSWLLNVRNGTLDLRTGQLRAHQQADLLTKCAPVVYDPEASCPTWEAFLHRILDGDTALIRFVQKAVGYSLTGSTEEQCLFMLYGTGANGKSTLIQTVSALLGDYARQTPTETLLIKPGDTVRNDLARLQGARFVAAVEAEGGRRLAEVLVKQLTGGDTITARYLYKEHFEFQPTFKIWLAVNHKPVVQGTDHAIWRRVCLLPFTVTIPQGEQDKRLAEKLKGELPGILHWALEGCLAWQKEGLESPSAVQQVTKKYREEMDVIAAFFEQCCVMGPQQRVRAGAVYAAYEAWCKDMGETPISRKALAGTFKERGLQSDHDRNGTLWCGIALRNDEPEPHGGGEV